MHRSVQQQVGTIASGHIGGINCTPSNTIGEQEAHVALLYRQIESLCDQAQSLASTATQRANAMAGNPPPMPCAPDNAKEACEPGVYVRIERKISEASSHVGLAYSALDRIWFGQ